MTREEMIYQIRGVLISIALAWWITTLIALWFLLDGNAVVAAIWIGIQAFAVSALSAFGWAHLRALLNGSDEPQAPLYSVFAGVMLSYGAVAALHGVINAA